MMSLKIKVFPKPTIKGKMDVRFPARVFGGIFIKIIKANGNYTISPDYSGLNPLDTFDPSQKMIAVQDKTTKEFGYLTPQVLFGNTEQTIRKVTEAGDIAVSAVTQFLVMNRGADENPSKIYLPLSTQKIGTILVSDFKGNAGSFPHDVYTQGADTFPGGLTKWTIGADTASVQFSPIPGVGYAV